MHRMVMIKIYYDFINRKKYKDIVHDLMMFLTDNSVFFYGLRKTGGASACDTEIFAVRELSKLWSN